jgi:hypothetical protein
MGVLWWTNLQSRFWPTNLEQQQQQQQQQHDERKDPRYDPLPTIFWKWNRVIAGWIVALTLGLPCIELFLVIYTSFNLPFLAMSTHYLTWQPLALGGSPLIFWARARSLGKCQLQLGTDGLRCSSGLQPLPKYLYTLIT